MEYFLSEAFVHWIANGVEQVAQVVHHQVHDEVDVLLVLELVSYFHYVFVVQEGHDCLLARC